MASLIKAADYDLKNSVAENRLLVLWRLMTGYQIIYLGATLSLGISTLSKTATYLLIRDFIDNLLGQPDASSKMPIILLEFVCLAIIQAIFTFLSGRLSAQASEGIVLRLRNYLFDHIQRLSFSYHDKTQTGELIQRSTSDVDAIRRFFADQAIAAGRIILLFIINFITLLLLNSQLALLSIIVIPFIVAMSLFFFGRVSKAYEAYQKQDAKVFTTLQENLTGVRVVKAFARQDHERSKFNDQNWEKFLRGRRLLKMHSLYWPISDILCGAQMLFGFYVGANMAMSGTITIGTYLAFIGLIVWIIWPMRNLGRLIVQMSTGLVSAGRVMKLINEDREPIDEGKFHPRDNLRGEIVFKDVTFRYESGIIVLDKINFACKPGQTIALMGSTGSGKTSLVNLLPRFYEYTNGSVTIDGIELKDLPRHYLRRQIGIVEQEPFLFSRSIRENIAYSVGHSVSNDEIEAAAHAAAINDVIESFPDGYDTLVGEKGVTLSGGQKQRIAIARALLKDPRILILDDCTSSVDTETESRIHAALQQLMKGRTSFLITHRIQSLINADFILVFDHGKIIQRGSHAELLREEGIYRRIYEIQTKIDTEEYKEIADD